MGYYTIFDLKIHKDERPKNYKPIDWESDPFGEEIHGDNPIEVLRNHSEEARYAFNEYGNPEDTTKWYQYGEDMIWLSEKYPDIVFKLHGEGEENGDLWDCYFKNGKVQSCRARIVYDDFDEDELQEPKRLKNGMIVI